MDFRARVRLFYRLAKPGIIYANVLTAAAGYLFGSRLHVDWLAFISLLGGVAAVIGGACAYNNYLDRSIDRRMKRTKSRGLVTGDIAGWQALTFATVLTLGGLGLLAWRQNSLTLILIIIALVDYVILYGYSKRHSQHGTLVGCISGAIPLMAGYTAATGRLDLTATMLFALMVVWQMAHFYGIALFRLKDYKAADIPVMPAVRGPRSTQLQALVYIGLFVLLSIVTVATDVIGWVAGIVLVVIGTVWFGRSLRSFKLLTPEKWGRQMFLFSLLVLLGMVALLSIDPLLV